MDTSGHTSDRVLLDKYSPTKIPATNTKPFNRHTAGLSPRTVAYIRTVLRIALNRAVRWGLVPRNVAALTDPPRVIRAERAVMTLEQARAFLDAANCDRLEALYRVALALGLRLGEALGLRWQDLDLDAGTLWVRHASSASTARYN